MKKRIIIVLIILLILLFPIKNTYLDGGSKEYVSLIYKVIKWNRLNNNYEGGYKIGTEVHLFPFNFKNIDYFDDIVPQRLVLLYNNGDIESQKLGFTGEYNWCNLYNKCEYSIPSMISDISSYILFDTKIDDKIYYMSPVNIKNITIYKDSFENVYSNDILFNDDYIYTPHESGKYLYKIYASNEKSNVTYYFGINVK